MMAQMNLEMLVMDLIVQMDQMKHYKDVVMGTMEMLKKILMHCSG